MAWGIFITGITLFGMMVLAIVEASMTEVTSEASADYKIVDGAAPEKQDMRKAA